jgi:hypothetical protein
MLEKKQGQNLLSSEKLTIVMFDGSLQHQQIGDYRIRELRVWYRWISAEH